MSTLAHPRRVGERSESAVIELLPWLRYVTDETAEHYDAVAREDSGDVQEGDPIEIKSAAVVLASGDPGRFYIREGQHERLLEADGWYLFVVATPNAKRRVLSYRFIRADVLDDELAEWWDAGEGRQPYRQLRVSLLFDDEELDNECRDPRNAR